MCHNLLLSHGKDRYAKAFQRNVYVYPCLVCLFFVRPQQGFGNFDVLLTVHLSIFILILNNLMQKFFFYNKFIIFLYMFRAPCAHRQEVKIVLYSIWYRHTCRWPSGAQSSLNLCTGRPPAECDDTRCCIIQFWPPDDEHSELQKCVAR